MSILKETLSLYKKESFSEKLRIGGRAVLGCYSRIIKKTPSFSGRVLDFGCGHGLYLNLLRNKEKVKNGLGIDIDADKIKVAEKVGLNGLEFKVQDILDTEGEFQAILTSDVFYLIPFSKWDGIFETFHNRLESQGQLVIKTVLKKKNWKHILGVIQEFLAVHVLRITSRRDSGFVFLDSNNWKIYLSKLGFEVTGFHELGWTPYNHALILCRKRN